MKMPTTASLTCSSCCYVFERNWPHEKHWGIT